MFPNNNVFLMFSIMPILFFSVFSIIVIIFVVLAVKSLRQWQYNNSQPILNVTANIVSKRTNVSSHMHNTNQAFDNHTCTSYYITFEVESGSRVEFKVTGKEYGLLAENDFGNLKFQGSRYLGFERIDLQA